VRQSEQRLPTEKLLGHQLDLGKMLLLLALQENISQTVFEVRDFETSCIYHFDVRSTECDCICGEPYFKN
jgi:hypothetical protein